jgi:hypothetical protein
VMMVRICHVFLHHASAAPTLGRLVEGVPSND